MRKLNLTFFAKIVVPAAMALLLAGCGLGGGVDGSHTPAAVTGALSVTGKVHGGQQPVGGSNINIYAVGTGSYGAAAVSLLHDGVTVKSGTDGSGSFTLTGQYTCTAEQRVFVTATDGDAGSGANGALALMAALGRCGDLTSSTFISINEVTTVASVWALAPFMKGITNVGAPASNVAGMNNAFADVNTLASISSGSAGGNGLPAGTTIPVAAINTLADILAACINSDGTGGACGTLFAGATVGGVVPTDTVTAALNMAQHPAAAVAALYSLATPQSPFQPTLADQPSDFTLAATFSGFATPTALAVDGGGNVWVTDSTTNKLTELSHAGAPVTIVSGMSAPAAVAIDQSGFIWVANAGNASVAKVTAVGAVSTFSGGGLNVPQSIAIDGQGDVWLANAGGASVSGFGSDGTALSGSGFASGGGMPVAVGISPR